MSEYVSEFKGALSTRAINRLASIDITTKKELMDYLVHSPIISLWVVDGIGARVIKEINDYLGLSCQRVSRQENYKAPQPDKKNFQMLLDYVNGYTVEDLRKKYCFGSYSIEDMLVISKRKVNMDKVSKGANGMFFSGDCLKDVTKEDIINCAKRQGLGELEDRQKKNLEDLEPLTKEWRERLVADDYYWLDDWLYDYLVRAQAVNGSDCLQYLAREVWNGVFEGGVEEYSPVDEFFGSLAYVCAEGVFNSVACALGVDKEALTQVIEPYYYNSKIEQPKPIGFDGLKSRVCEIEKEIQEVRAKNNANN